MESSVRDVKRVTFPKELQPVYSVFPLIIKFCPKHEVETNKTIVIIRVRIEAPKIINQIFRFVKITSDVLINL